MRSVGLTHIARPVLDAAGYALALTAVVVFLIAPLSALLGMGLNGIKVGLFVTGFLYFGYATFLMRPSKRDFDERRTEASSSRDETHFERFLGRVPLVRRYRVEPAERLSPGTKLFLASLLMLAISFAMESLFDIYT